MYKKLLASSLLQLLIVVGIQSQTVSFGTEINPDGKSLTITGFKGSASEITVPQTIDGLPVTAIGDDAFDNKGLTSLVLPEGLETIGFFSFTSNKLASLTIPSTVTKIVGAFSNNMLESVVFPDNLIEIGTISFQANKLTAVTLPAKLEKIGQLAFASNQLTEIVIPDSVHTIDSGAFADNGLRSIVLPGSIKELYTNIFIDNYLTSLVVPDSVTDIRGGFWQGGNKITTVTIGENVNFEFDNDPIDALFYDCYTGNGRQKGTYVFDGGKWTKN
ncbi:MAG: leucine-rich repeat domain-containing protein [Treponema sp.]|nr:leucine-rich repeat domain-containing protein [Treponema sp.]